MRRFEENVFIHGRARSGDEQASDANDDAEEREMPIVGSDRVPIGSGDSIRAARLEALH